MDCSAPSAVGLSASPAPQLAPALSTRMWGRRCVLARREFAKGSIIKVRAKQFMVRHGLQPARLQGPAISLRLRAVTSGRRLWM